MKNTKIRDIYLTFSSQIDLENSDNLERVLKQIEIPGLKPEFMNIDDRKHDPYDEAMVRDELKSKLSFGLGIKRGKSMKYYGKIKAGPEGNICFIFHNSISKNNIQKLFTLSDDIANAYPPEAGGLTIVPKPPSLPTGDLRFEQTFNGSILQAGTHASYGPKLGMYTWLCKRHVDAIGLDNLKATPLLTVEEKEWGGVKLILGESQRPWEMDLDTWVETWHTAMDHLRQFHVFCYTVVDGNKIRVYRGKNCHTPRPDGIVRDVTSYLEPEDCDNT